MSFENICPGAKKILQPSPEEFRCLECGTKVEIWSDEMSTECTECGSTVSRHKEAHCFDWCASAEQCIGVMKYNKLKRAGMITPQDAPPKPSEDAFHKAPRKKKS